MNTEDVGRGPLIAAISAIALLIFMFFAWYGVDSISASGFGFEQEISGDQLEQFGGGADTSANAWQAFSFIDILLLITILGVVGLAVARATGAAIDLPVPAGTLIAGLGGVAFLLILFRLIFTPDAAGGADLPAGVEVDVDVSRKIGVFLGLLAAAGMAVGGWLASQEEETGLGAGDRFAGEPGTGGPPPAAPPPGGAPGEQPAAPPPPPPPPPPPRGQ